MALRAGDGDGGHHVLVRRAGNGQSPRRKPPIAAAFLNHQSGWYRILIFYIGSLTVLLSLYPWGQVVESGSPFVLIFHALNSNLVATVLNVVVLTAALSVYNSGVYASSRMLFGLAKQCAP